MDEVLRAFLNIDENRQIIGLALITIHKLVRDRYVAESVGLVQAADGLLVAPQQSSAIAAAPELHERSAHQEHALPDGFRPEILVALNADRSEEHTSELQSRQYLVC